MDRLSFERWLVRRATRRQLMAGAAAVAVSLRGRPTLAQGTPETSANAGAGGSPFTLGVASGDPLPDGVVLWTRLAPDPVTGGGLEPTAQSVRWEVASDDSFRAIVQQGETLADPELAHSVHIDVDGLQPGADYFYRFMAGDAVSATGRTRTAPAAAAPLDRLRFGFASCANWEHGFFGAYRDLAAQDLDMILFLGDYLYEYGSDGEFQSTEGGPVRLVTGGETMTLADYRNRHALYKTDPNLQAAHQAFPWIVTWDDHEVENDYAGAVDQAGDPPDAFLARRAAAYQAYYEHMPLRPSSLPVGPEMSLYRRLSFGDLLQLNVLDTRQYRSDQPCGDTIGPRCAAALDPALTMTGGEQETWLLDGLTSAETRWKVLGQQVMMGELAVRLGATAQFSDDQWDGYPLARNRILETIRDAAVSDVVVLAGDVHSAWVNDLKADFLDTSSPVVATEFVATSISADNPIGERLTLLPVMNPHIKFVDLRHGYVLCDVGRDRWQTDFRAMETAREENAPVTTIASFVVESGIPGAVAQ